MSRVLVNPSAREKNWWVSPYNYEEEVWKGQKITGPVEIHDSTLREGEETPSVVFSADDKIKIAGALCDLGIRRIEVAMLYSPDGPEALKKVADLGLDAKIFTACRPLKKYVDLAVECGVEGLVLVAGSSDSAIEGLSETNRRDMLEQSIIACEYAKAHGLYTTLFASDATRADLVFF